MAQTIKILRSTGNSAPSSLNAGELAYTGGAGTAGNYRGARCIRAHKRFQNWRNEAAGGAGELEEREEP